MALSTPIGYVNSSDAGDFQFIDSDGKTFLAYKAGQHLALSSAGGSLTKTSSGNTLIGSFTDTKYPNIGDSDTVSLIITTTNIYQDATVPSETDDDFTRPIGHAIKGNGQHYFQAMDDTNLNILVDDLVERIFKYDMIGSYQLATSAPSGDYTVAVSNVITDTRADGTSNQYNIYQRTSMTAPAHDSSDFPLILKDSDGSYSRKLIRMDSDQMLSTFGQRSRKRIGGGSVGTYQIRTSAQGAPTDTGTWVAKGSATDTRQAIAYSDYLGNFTADYLGNFLGDYARNYTRTRVSNYAGDYIGASGTGFASSFAGQTKFVGNYVGGVTDFAGQGAFSAAYTRTSTQDFTRTSSFTRDFTRSSNFSRNFTRTSNFSRNFTRTSNYSRSFTATTEPTAYTRTSTRSSQRTITNPTSPYQPSLGTYAGNYVGNYLGPESGYYTRTFNTYEFIGNYVGPTLSSFVYNESTDYWFAGSTITIVYGGVNKGSYSYGAIVTIGGRTAIYATDGKYYFQGSQGTTNPAGTFYGVAQGTGTADYTRTVVNEYINYTEYQDSTPATQYGWNKIAGSNDGVSIWWNGTQIVDRTGVASDNLITEYEHTDGYTYRRGAQTGSGPGVTYYAVYRGRRVGGAYVGNYGTPSTVNYSRTITRSSNYAGDFSRTSTYTGDFTRTSSYLGDFTRTSNYVGNYVGNYARAFLRQSAANYTRTSQQNFVGNYSGGDDPILRQSNYLGTGRDGVSSNFSRFFTTTNTAFTGTYTNTFTRNYIGNYTGGRVGPSSESIETYTLYVRVA